jgi:hypothetical protein
MAPIVSLSPSELAARRPPGSRYAAVGVGVTAAVFVGAATGVLLGLAKLRSAMSIVVPSFSGWHGDYLQVASFIDWIVGDTTEPGYAHSALAGTLMVCGGCLAHWAFRRGKRWTGFPVASGTGLFLWGMGSAGLGLVLSNLAWGWTIGASGVWQPTFVPFASVPPAVVQIYGGRPSVALTGAMLGAGLTTPVALAAVNLGCRPLGLPNVVGTTTGMWFSALIAFILCRRLPWMPAPAVTVPRCDAGSPHCCVDTARQGPGWVARRILTDLTEAQFIGNEWSSAGLLVGTLASYLLNPAMTSSVGDLLPRLLIAQVLSAGLAVALWHRQWAKYGWYPTFVPVVSVAPATVLALGGTVEAIIAGATLGALAAPPVAAAIARRLPPDFHPFIGNVVSMAVMTAVIVTALSAMRDSNEDNGHRFSIMVGLQAHSVLAVTHVSSWGDSAR